jgi:hypothetical protein
MESINQQNTMQCHAVESPQSLSMFFLHSHTITAPLNYLGILKGIIKTPQAVAEADAATAQAAGAGSGM